MLLGLIRITENNDKNLNYTHDNSSESSLIVKIPFPLRQNSKKIEVVSFSFADTYCKYIISCSRNLNVPIKSYSDLPLEYLRFGRVA